MKYNKAIAQTRSMLYTALQEDRHEQVSNLVGLLLQLQKDYIFEMEKEKVVMVKVYEIKLSDGRVIEIGARNEREALKQIKKEYSLFVMSIKEIKR